MRELRLKMISHVDFRKSEETNFRELVKSGQMPTLKKGEGVLFISKKKDQMVFVQPATDFVCENQRGREVSVSVLASERFRIKGSTWNPLMLANYADTVGIKVQGIKRFEWYYRKYAEAA